MLLVTTVPLLAAHDCSQLVYATTMAQFAKWRDRECWHVRGPARQPGLGGLVVNVGTAPSSLLFTGRVFAELTPRHFTGVK